MQYIDKLDSIRVSKGMSVRQLCLACDLSESSVKKILSKKCSPNIISLEKICTSLDLPLAQLFIHSDELIFKKTETNIAILDVLRSLPYEATDALLTFIKNLQS
jgi:transcriptional regulator with XRE-family HTH domain